MMNFLSMNRASETRVTDLTVDALLEEAQTHGRPMIRMMDNGWHASIEFPTIAGTSLMARSGFNHETPCQALVEVIEKARTIRAAFK